MVYNKVKCIMKKFTTLKSMLFTALLCVIALPQAFAQISDGNPTFRTIRTGNRPQKGTYGIYLGMSLSQMQAISDDELKWDGIPIINLKYFASDNLEWRASFVANNTTRKNIKGEIEGFDGKSYDIREKDRDGGIYLTPGVAYHFNSKNILDIYVGGALPLGYSYDNYVLKLDNDHNGTCKRSSFDLGLEGFIGIQCFVADLPLALGLEYGFSGVINFGQKYKNIYVDGEGDEQVFYTVDKPNGADVTEYTKLKSKKGRFGSDFRITISYYFNK